MAISIRRSRSRKEAGELPIAPMIDVVFLLLVYFMVSSSIQKQEADIGFRLPAVVESREPVSFPDEQIIEIDAEGRAWINGYAYDDPKEVEFTELTKTLARYKEASTAGQTEAKVTLAPSEKTPHEYVIRVMDSCNRAGISSVGFAVGR